jgi:hypothetical protein
MARSSSSLRLSMGCSFCAPQSRAGDAMVAQTGFGPADEHRPGATYQGNGVHEIPRLRPTAPGTSMVLAPPRLPLRISGIYAGDRPPSGSGSCQRGRDRGMHRPHSFRPCSELCIPGISLRLRVRNVAHFAILTWPGPPPLPAFRSNNTKADRWRWRSPHKYS